MSKMDPVNVDDWPDPLARKYHALDESVVERGGRVGHAIQGCCVETGRD